MSNLVKLRIIKAGLIAEVKRLNNYALNETRCTGQNAIINGIRDRINVQIDDLNIIICGLEKAIISPPQHPRLRLMRFFRKTA